VEGFLLIDNFKSIETQFYCAHTKNIYQKHFLFNKLFNWFTSSVLVLNWISFRYYIFFMLKWYHFKVLIKTKVKPQLYKLFCSMRWITSNKTIPVSLSKTAIVVCYVILWQAIKQSNLLQKARMYECLSLNVSAVILVVSVVATFPVALCWMCDSPRTGCARKTTIYICGANKQW